jgi:hypothetical protein
MAPHSFIPLQVQAYIYIYIYIYSYSHNVYQSIFFVFFLSPSPRRRLSNNSNYMFADCTDLFGSHQSQRCTFPDWIYRRRQSSSTSPRTPSPSVAPPRSAIVWRDLAGTGSTFETDDTGDILRRSVSSRSRPGLQVGWSQQSSSAVTTATSLTVQSFRCLHGWSSNDTYSPIARHRHPVDTFSAMTLVHNIW